MFKLMVGRTPPLRRIGLKAGAAAPGGGTVGVGGGVGEGTAVLVGNGVGVGPVVLLAISTAPMSHNPFCGRMTSLSDR